MMATHIESDQWKRGEESDEASEYKSSKNKRRTKTSRQSQI